MALYQSIHSYVLIENFILRILNLGWEIFQYSACIESTRSMFDNQSPHQKARHGCIDL